MQGLDVRSGPSRPDRTTQILLADFDAYVRWVWPILPDPLIIKWSDSLVLALDGEAPWIFGPADRDPLQDLGGATVLPRRARKRLLGFAASGVPFQQVAIAHQLNSDGPIRQLLPALRSGPRTCTDEVARDLVGEVPPHPLVAGAVRVMKAAVDRTASTTLARIVLDPIIFGVLAPKPPRHCDLCLWYPLAAWRW